MPYSYVYIVRDSAESVYNSAPCDMFICIFSGEEFILVHTHTDYIEELRQKLKRAVNEWRRKYICRKNSQERERNP